jgi:hypothetical protein
MSEDAQPGSRSGMAWAALVLCGWMVVVRLAQGVMGLVATQTGKSTSMMGGGVFSFLAAGFYVWALVGLTKRKPSAYRYVIRVNALLALLGLLGGAFSYSVFGLSTSLIVQLVAIVFHLAALAVTHAARHELGYEWDD